MESTAIPATMVPGYEHMPGHHCGSTALRNLLRFEGVELSEEMAFGLGAGAAFYYFTLEQGSPSRFINGRTARLEESFRELTGGALELRTFDSPTAAWDAARSEIEDGRPVLLLTDLYYLDHYGRSAHFPGHAVVLAGFDGEVAYLSDTAFEELQTTRLDNLLEARHSEHPAYPLRGHMFSAAGTVDGERLQAAIPQAIEQAVRGMLEPEWGENAGLPAVRRLAAEVADWPQGSEDWQWCARFAYQVLERRGTGGGNFRLMYSRFLDEAGYPKAASLAAEAGRMWTELAEAFFAASEREEPEAELWEEIGAAADRCLAAEERLWTALAS